MNLQVPRNPRTQSSTVSTVGWMKASPWRSIFGRSKHFAEPTEAVYSQPYSISNSFDRPSSLLHNPGYDMLRGQRKPPSRASSMSSWSPFGRKDQIENHSPRLTAREAYHRRRVKKSGIARLMSSRSKTIDTHRVVPRISAPLYQPSQQWLGAPDSASQVEVQSSVGSEEASEAVFTLTRHPDPEARMTVQYSPRTSSWRAAERLIKLNHIITPAQDLAEHDPDKRNPIFDRIHPDGWNKILPKQWVEDEFSDDEAKTIASQSVYSRDPEGSDIVEQPLIRTGFDNEQRPDRHPRLISRLAETSNPRFVFEDGDEQGEGIGKKKKLHQDQLWWQDQTDALHLSSTPYHHNPECSSDRLPWHIETVSQLKQAGGGTRSRLKATRHSDGIRREQLTTRDRRPRANTSPARLMRPPDPPPRSPTRRTVDEFFNLAGFESLTPLPLRTRHGRSEAEQRRRRRTHDDGTTVKQPGDMLPPGEAASSSDQSWETIRCVPEEEKRRARDPCYDATNGRDGNLHHNSPPRAAQSGTKHPQNLLHRNESDLEQNVNDILNLYLAGAHSRFPPDSGHSASSTQHPDGRYATVLGSNDSASAPGTTDEAVSTAPWLPSSNNHARDGGLVSPTSHRPPSSQSQFPVPFPVPPPPPSERHLRALKPIRPSRPRASDGERGRSRGVSMSSTTAHRLSRNRKNRHGPGGETSPLHLHQHQHALSTGEYYPQSPASRRWNGSGYGYGNHNGNGSGSTSGNSAEERRTSNPGVRLLPVTVIDEFGNTWI